MSLFKKKGKWWKRVAALALSFCIGLGSGGMAVSADSLDGDGTSNDIISTFINLAKGQSATDLSGTNLDEDQLRFLGVYASNFFVPFSTELGSARGDNTEQVVEQMAEALTVGLKFDDIYAQSFAETLIGLARGSIKDLKIAFSNSYQEDYVIPEADDLTLRNTYYNYLASMIGGVETIINESDGRADAIDDWSDEEKQEQKDKLESYKNMTYGYWGYEDGGEFIPVSDFYVSRTDGMTASQMAFLNCLRSSNWKQGYGWNLFDLNSSDVDSDGDDFDIQPGLGGELYSGLSAIGATMKVDCFGDIIIYGAQHQTIAVPGCINPYTWVAVDASGTDLLNPGEAYNLINLRSMWMADQNIIGGNITDAAINTTVDENGNVTESGTTINTLKAYTLIQSEQASTYYGLLTAVDETLPDVDARTNFLVSIENILKAICSNPESSFVADWGGYTEEGNATLVNVSATISDWRALRTSFLDSSVSTDDLATQYGITSEEAENIISTIESELDNMNALLSMSSTSINLTRETMLDRVTALVRAAQNIEAGDSNQETDESTGRTSHLLKSIQATFQRDTADTDGKSYNCSFLSDYLNGDGNSTIFLRVISGNNSTDLDDEFGFWASKEFKNAWAEACNWNVATYPYDIGPINTDWVHDDMSVEDPGTTAYDHVDLDIGGKFPSQVLYIMDNLIVIDQLGAFMGDGASSDYRTFQSLNYFTDSSGSTINTTSQVEWNYGGDDFSAGYTSALQGSISAPTNVSESAIVSLYTTYLLASLYEDTPTARSETIGRVGYRMNNSGLPEIPAEPLELSDEAQSDLMLTAIRDWLYYLLHPIEGINYVRELLTNKINGFLLGWHNDMLGTNGVGQNTGTTLYRSNIGYVTTPDLSEIQWTDALINFYNQCIPFLLIVMIVTMVFSYITGVLSLQKSIFGVVIFGIFLLLPVNLINGVVNFSNRISENIYGEKFTYWALIQQESYASAIDSAAQSDSYQNYLMTLYQTNNSVYSNQGAESIVLKWQAPKKMTSIMISNDETYQSLTSGGQQLLNQFLGNSFSGESFVDDEDAVYLYRSYLDISNYSRYVYNGINEGTVSSTKNLTNDITYSWTEGLKDSVGDMSTAYQEDRNNGFTNANDSGNELSSGIKITVPMSSKIYSDAIAKLGTVTDLTIDDFVGINQNAFNIGIPVFNKGLEFGEDMLDELLANTQNATEGERQDLQNNYNSYTEADWIGLAAYALYSENVFYYFSWDLYDLGLEPSSNTSSGYKDLLLGAENAGFFYNTVSNGELKDFMDMKSLFTYIIPYLRMGNQLVHEWDDVYGLFTYDGVPTEEGHWDDTDIKGNTEMEQKYWHNLNVARLYGLYCPWVDVMYDCSYANGEYINAMGERFYVSDPIDPSTYPEERPMIFSESEMHEYGLGEGDLTKVERLILDCNRGMEERMYELLNYYNFSDVTLNTAAAMNCAFEFNNTFSENGIFSENHNIYPQSFELADFSYDAFLRFILSNTTGEVMNTTDDFYANIVENSSMTTILVMLILDVLSMYVLPAFKIFFLIAVFLSALLIIVTTSFRVDPEQKFIKRLATGVLVPMLKFMLITIGFAYVISLFMGTGNNAVTQTNEISIQMGDPVVVMLAMCAIDIIVLILYFKVIKKIVQDIKTNAKLSVNFMGGVFGGAAAMVAGAIGGAAVAGGRAAGGGTRSARKGSPDGGDEQNGTGVENERAQRRGSHDVDSSSDRDEYDDTRRNDTKRDTVRPDQKTKSREDEKQKKEDLNKKTKRGMGKFNKSDKDADDSDVYDAYSDSSSRLKDKDSLKYSKSINDPGDKWDNDFDSDF